jgi:hypothetical protein
MIIGDRIYTIENKIFVIDYRGCKGEEMMRTATALKDLMLSQNKPMSVLTIFDDHTYVTPRFMRHAESETRSVLHLIYKMAYLGLSPTKKIILNGYNFIFQRNFQAFDTHEEAVAYLLQ